MAVAYPNATDRRTRDAVLEQVEQDPAVDATTIRVAVHDGVVTLTGFVDTAADTLAAERVATNVPGVKAVTNQIEVQPLGERSGEADIRATAQRPTEPVDEQC